MFSLIFVMAQTTIQITGARLCQCPQGECISARIKTSGNFLLPLPIMSQEQQQEKGRLFNKKETSVSAMGCPVTASTSGKLHRWHVRITWKQHSRFSNWSWICNIYCICVQLIQDPFLTIKHWCEIMYLQLAGASQIMLSRIVVFQETYSAIPRIIAKIKSLITQFWGSLYL